MEKFRSSCVLPGEIKRRKVFQVTAVYAVVAWLLVQIVATVEEPLGLPTWFDTGVIVLLLVGFPIAVILSWAFELTPEGIKSSAQVPRPEASVHATGQRLTYLTHALVLTAVGFLVVDQYVVQPRSNSLAESSTSAAPRAAPGHALRHRAAGSASSEKRRPTCASRLSRWELDYR